MFAQLRFIDAVILRQLRLELLQRVAFFRAWKPAMILRVRVAIASGVIAA